MACSTGTEGPVAPVTGIDPDPVPDPEPEVEVDPDPPAAPEPAAPAAAPEFAGVPPPPPPPHPASNKTADTDIERSLLFTLKPFNFYTAHFKTALAPVPLHLFVGTIEKVDTRD
jgi:hypothetical protein